MAINQQQPLAAVLQECLAIDALAHAAYAKFAGHCPEPTMARAWHELAREEKRHLSFWRKALSLAKRHRLPEIFERPEEVRLALAATGRQVRDELAALRRPEDPGATLALAYRLEAFMLDPAFMAMYRLFGTLDARLEADYADHIGTLAALLREHGGKSGNPHLGLLGEALDQLHRQNRELARQNATDPLTGLLNRRGFFNCVHPLTSLARRNDTLVGIIMGDIDDFKRVNDELGHPVGDRVLAAVAAVIAKNIRKSDIAGRYGGEEFIIFLNLAQTGSLVPVCRRVVRAVARQIPELAGVPVTISLGAAAGRIRGPEERQLATLIKRADDHLLAAKRSGKNCWVTTARQCRRR